MLKNRIYVWYLIFAVVLTPLSFMLPRVSFDVNLLDTYFIISYFEFSIATSAFYAVCALTYYVFRKYCNFRLCLLQFTLSLPLVILIQWMSWRSDRMMQMANSAEESVISSYSSLNTFVSVSSIMFLFNLILFVVNIGLCFKGMSINKREN